ncbi:exo-alpha-sialidase [Ravibacter arvi]|uniref:Exo-alpha-sialidase n=1 Tax=Ravibacter arvi TaxID=2051041 RepID=A0ABP8MBX3_9BACT
MIVRQRSRRLLAVAMLSTVPALYSCNQAEKSEAKEDSAAAGIAAQKDFVFGDDRPFPQCHASTLVRTDDGQFVVAWFGGTKEKDDDVGIWVSTGRPGNWSAPKEVAKLREDPHWNPVLHRGKDGKVYLFFKVGKEISHWETWVQVSEDNGATWSAAHELVAGDRGGRGPVKNKMIELSDGTWLAGASIEPGRWLVMVDRSEDQGKTWVESEKLKMDTVAIKGKGAIQPTLWESAPGKVHMLVRTTGGVIGRSDSEDNGKTWSEIKATSLPNPNSGIDLTRLPDGTLALMYNPDDENWGSRSPVSLALSYDNGETWPDKIDIDAGDKKDEFSYPAIISWGDSVATTYTWNRQKIAFWMGTKDQVKNWSASKKAEQ